MQTKTRPYARLSGADLIALIEAGDKAALTEGEKFRSVPSVKAAVKAAKAQTPAKVAQVKAARPKGPGSRGGNPVKAACARKADEIAPRATSEWWVAYRKATAVAKAAGLL